LRNRLTRFLLGLGVGFACALGLLPAAPAALGQTDPDADKKTKIAALKQEKEQAVEQVKKIVNQPVTRYARVPGLKVTTFKPGWFHDGATKPDFNTVDVRKTQEFPYDPHPFVTSDLTPAAVFKGTDLEFNSMTKFFYSDRTVPKKKLTEPEMLEINRLYRIIGKCDTDIAALLMPTEEPAAAPANETESAPASPPNPPASFIKLKAALGIALVLVLYIIYRSFRRPA